MKAVTAQLAQTLAAGKMAGSFLSMATVILLAPVQHALAPNTDCLLRVHDAFTDNQLTVAGLDPNAAAINSFTFSSRGQPKSVIGASQSGVFSLCSLDTGGSTIDSRAVVLSLSGRVRVSDNAAVITCP